MSECQLCAGADNASPQRPAVARSDVGLAAPSGWRDRDGDHAEVITVGRSHHPIGLLGRPVVDVHGTSLGRVQDVLLDQMSRVPAWLLVGRRRRQLRAVPISRAHVRRGQVSLAVQLSEVLDSPAVPWGQALDAAFERRLMAYWDALTTS